MIVRHRIAFAACLHAQLALAQATPPAGPPPVAGAAPRPGRDVASEPSPPAPAAPPEQEPAARPTSPTTGPKPEPAAAPGSAGAPAPGEADDVFAAVEQELTAPVGNMPARASSAPAARPGAQSMNPDLTLIADFAAAWFSSRDHWQTGSHDPTRTGFNLQALELAASSVVDPYLRFDAVLVFGQTGVELEEAYGTTLDLPGGLQARFGQFLTRFGRINATHPHAQDFADQPFALGRIFGGEASRGLGVELSWFVPLPWYAELLVSATDAAGEGTARSFYGARDLGVERPADLLYVTALKQFFDLSPDWSLMFGLSGAFGPNSTGRDNRTEVYGTDVYLKYRPITQASTLVLSWQTEVVHRRRQLPGALLWDVGGYSQLFARFARRWGAALRHEVGSPAYDLGGSVATDPLDPEWRRFRHRAGASVSHYPSEFSRFRLQGSRDTGGAGNPVWAAFLTAELVVGAHGAHTF